MLRTTAAQRCYPGRHHRGTIDGVDRRRFDGIDVPIALERERYLIARNATRSIVARFTIAETQQVVASARRDDSPQLHSEAEAVVVTQDMEEPAIEHGVKLHSQTSELGRVADGESRRQPSLSGLGACNLDGLCRRIDTCGRKAQLGRHQCVLSGAAPNVQHVTGQAIFTGDLQQRRLRAPDVPPGPAPVDVLVILWTPPAGLPAATRFRLDFQEGAPCG